MARKREKVNLGRLLEELQRFRKREDLLSIAAETLAKSSFREAVLEAVVEGVTSNSKEVRPGFIFVAVEGESVDGHRFVEDALKQGALLCIGRRPLDLHGLESRYFFYPDLIGRRFLSALAASFYGFPSDEMLVVGVTGTSGKTTTTYLLEAILKAAGRRVGVVGTIGNRFEGLDFYSGLTTPGPAELQAMLAEMRAAGCDAIVMEVSSHALKQGRVDDVSFDCAIFTNLSPEHLDFHPSMEDYFQAKRLLFSDRVQHSLARGKNPLLVVNALDEWGSRLLLELRECFANEPAVRIKPFSSVGELHSKIEGVSGVCDGVKVESLLTGNFNISNIAGAVSAGLGLGFAPSQVALGLKALPGVPGRLERIPNSCGFHVWVDYAHKPDALQKVLETLKAIKGAHRLLLVFGCGGDRDRTKRPKMGQIAVEWCDWVWITSDNPRTEDPIRIIEEICQGARALSNFQVEVDRKRAIELALGEAKTGDLVLIAGKGHEDYQILGTEKIHFDDREVARNWFLGPKEKRG